MPPKTGPKTCELRFGFRIAQEVYVQYFVKGISMAT